MTKSSRTRWVATAAAYGGGSLGLAGALLTGVLVGEAKLARRAIRPPDHPPPACDGRYGAEYTGAPLTFAMLGDSSAAGMGVDLPRETPGALLAAGLADIMRRPVELVCPAVVGAQSEHLSTQVTRALSARPDVAVILIGVNDVTHRVRTGIAVGHLTEAVRRLRAVGTAVVVGTCPDLGTVQPIRPPLRWLTRQWSRQLATAQTVSVVAAGGRTVSLGDLLGAEFIAAPDRMFSADLFHPSAHGYAAAAAAILPTLAAAAGAPAELGVPAERAAHPDVHSLPFAAAVAAEHAGTEVSAAGVPAEEAGGHQRNRWHRLVQLRQRVRMLTARPVDPDTPADTSRDAPANGGPAALQRDLEDSSTRSLSA